MKNLYRLPNLLAVLTLSACSVPSGSATSTRGFPVSGEYASHTIDPGGERDLAPIFIDVSTAARLEDFAKSKIGYQCRKESGRVGGGTFLLNLACVHRGDTAMPVAVTGTYSPKSLKLIFNLQTSMGSLVEERHFRLLRSSND